MQRWERDICFRKGDNESLFYDWVRYNEFLRQCPYYGVLICIQLETSYNGLLPSSRKILDSSSSGSFLSKSYKEGYKLIDRIIIWIH